MALLRVHRALLVQGFSFLIVTNALLKVYRALLREYRALLFMRLFMRALSCTPHVPALRTVTFGGVYQKKQLCVHPRIDI